MRHALVALWIGLCLATSVSAQVSLAVRVPGVSIGINLPAYPELVPVPGYPVYYAPRVNSNFFFYDGMYWVYQADSWYASSWYNGPWGRVSPEAVPLYVLRVPVRYYRSPPVYFQGWRADAPPRWGEHWGNAWEQRRAGWDDWDRRSIPRAAPLPVYQRRYSGDRYPAPEEQRALQGRSYHYQPRDTVVQQHYQAQPSAPQGPPARRAGDSGRPSEHAQAPVQSVQGAPTAQHQRQQPQQGMAQRPPQPQQMTAERGQPPPQRQSHDKGAGTREAVQETRHGDKGEEHGGERGK